MRVAIDTDAFCKLGIGGLLDDAADLLGATLAQCGRLPALPHMLRRGSLRRRFGGASCDALLPVAQRIPVVAQSSDEWLGPLALMEAVDPGEALIFATAAQHKMIVLTGDKRALRALKELDSFVRALDNRVVALEAILIALCDRLGVDVLRERIQSLSGVDQMINICFSDPRSDPRVGLRSYFENLAGEVAPLILWSPADPEHET